MELKPGKLGRRDEGRERILAAIPDGATLSRSTSTARRVTTQGLSVMLSGWMRDATHPAFVIGGADGLSDEVKERADKLCRSRR